MKSETTDEVIARYVNTAERRARRSHIDSDILESAWRSGRGRGLLAAFFKAYDIKLLTYWDDVHVLRAVQTNGHKHLTRWESYDDGRRGIPELDHDQIWRTTDKRVILTSQPYAAVSSLEPVCREAAELLGLAVDVLPEAGWHAEGLPLVVWRSTL